MWRTIGSIVVGLIAWLVIVTLLNFGLRGVLPGYHAAEPTMQFTLPMMIGRLLIAAVASLAAGAVVSSIADGKRWASWAVGVILLCLFVPEHIRIWNKLPIWYHLAFLITLAPLVALGASLPPKIQGRAGAPRES